MDSAINNRVPKHWRYDAALCPDAPVEAVDFLNRASVLMSM
jgi:hypothetical protein